MLPGLCGIAGFAVDVSEFRHKHGHRDNGDRALVELDGFLVAALGSAQFTQPSHRAVVTGMDVERREISMVGCCHIAGLKFILAEFVVEPGEILRG